MTVPEALPDAPDEAVSQAAPLEADHAQPEAVVTLVVKVPLVAGIDADVGEAAKVQGAAACVTVIVLPATVTVPVRVDVAALAA